MEIQPLAIIYNIFPLFFPWRRGTAYDISVLHKDFRVIFTSSTYNVSRWLTNIAALEDVIVGIGVEYTGHRLNALKLCVDNSCLIFQLSWPITNFPPELLTFLNNSSNTLAALCGADRIRSRLSALENGLRLPRILNLSHLAIDIYPHSLDENASISDVVAECLGYPRITFSSAGSWDAEYIADDQVVNAATFTCAASMVAEKFLADLRLRGTDQGRSRQLNADAQPFIPSWESKYPTEQIAFLKSMYPWASIEAIGYALRVGDRDLNTTIHVLMQLARSNVETRSDPGYRAYDFCQQS